jgi:hypothetical protein
MLISLRRFRVSLSSMLVFAALLVAGLLIGGVNTALAATAVNTVDTGNIAHDNSLVLDAAGNPVIAYYDEVAADLKLAHCNDANCAGGGESITTVDNGGDVGFEPSMVLDSNGFPVIAYYAKGVGDLKLAHCNDVNCAGANESIQAVDSLNDVGFDPSLALDSSGFPVISYYDKTSLNLKLVHCNDANCAGANESIIKVETTGDVGDYSSLVLDGSGFPVISYFDRTNANLKLARCNDVNCAGGDDSLSIVHETNFIGSYTSLVLDAAGFPVISYYEKDGGNLRIAHCNDLNCTGGGENRQIIDSVGDVGQETMLRLDVNGYPVISYYDNTNDDLKLVYCNDVNCEGANEHFETLDSTGDVGSRNSLVLDSLGYPVVAYLDVTNADLKLAHCDSSCVPVPTTTLTVDPSTKNFGVVLVSSSSSAQVFTIDNIGGSTINIGTLAISGTHAGDFALGSDNCTGQAIAGGADCTFEVTFSPTATGSRTAQVDIPSDAIGSPHMVSLSGSGADANPAISISPSSKNFGGVDVGDSSAAQTFTITNTGFVDVHVGTLALSGTDSAEFGLSNNTCNSATITSGNTCTFQVTYTPADEGASTAQVDVPSDATGNPHAVALSGTGTPATSNLVLNGGFEDNDDPTPLIPDDWTKGKALQIGVDGQDCSQASAGSCSFKFVGTGVSKQLIQSITIAGASGDSYTLSFDTKSSGAGGSGSYLAKAKFFLANGDRVVYKIKVVKPFPTAWTHYQTTFSLPANYTKVEITIQYTLSQGTAWFDEVSLIQN